MSTITLYEDDPAIISLVTAILDSSGHQVKVIRHGGDALGDVSSKEAELYLIDVNLPSVNGFELVSAIRSQPDGANTPVIMITSDERTEIRNKAFEAGCDYFLVKPFFRSDLMRVVQLGLASQRS